MRRKQLSFGVVLFVCAMVGYGDAQKNQLTGIIGRTFVSDQIIPTSTDVDNKLRFGDGLTLEANISRKFWEAQALALSLEVPVVFNVDGDVHVHLNPAANGYSSIFVTPAARLNIFSNTAVSPWVSIGGGFGHFSGSAVQSQPNTGTTTGIFQIGGGLDVALTHSFSIRGEVRDFWSGVPNLHVTTNESRQHNLFVGGGLIWRFGKR